MTKPSVVTRLRTAGFAFGILVSPLHAEGNRLLPFWAQPYPYGYAWVETEGLPACPPFDRHHDERPQRRDPRCQVVLHARD